MPILDDDHRFEAELRRFTPREVAPLHPPRSARFRWRGYIAVAAAVLAAIGILLWNEHRTPASYAVLHSDVKACGLTLGRAEATLASAPSFEDAIDGLERDARPLPPKVHGKQSVFEVLGREEL